MWGLISWIIFGFFAGLVGRALMPGAQRMGCISTTALGVAGAFVGGWLGAAIFHGSTRHFEPSGFAGAVIGSIVLLAIGRWVFGRTR